MAWPGLGGNGVTDELCMDLSHLVLFVLAVLDFFASFSFIVLTLLLQPYQMFDRFLHPFEADFL